MPSQTNSPQHDKLLRQNTTKMDKNLIHKILMQAIREGSVGELREVLEKHPDPKKLVHHLDETGVTALHLAARYNRTEAVEVLVGYGADVSILNAKKNTALQIACRHRGYDVIKVLLKYGADQHTNVSLDGNVLHTIAMHSTAQAAQLLFDVHPPPIHSKSFSGFTPLHSAAEFGNDEMCVWLLHRGANPRARCARMMTPLMLASEQGHTRVIQILCQAVEHTERSVVMEMLNDVDDEGMSALHYAVRHNRYQVNLNNCIDFFLK
ncbi:ankyrin-1-like [Physella acuta]|uniref:ankyrin-1-like n=1 Tax=Physella acuta TaxID=109671 RepID=UPI0027DDE556|nr:ankyrin-1-like [Physella acuta]